MRDIIKTRAEAETATYGCGGFQRVPYNPLKCVESVRYSGTWPSYHQCERKPGFGPDNLYCKQHAPAAVEARNKKRDEAYDAKQRAQRPRWYSHQMLALLRESQTSIDGDWRERRDELIKTIDAQPPHGTYSPRKSRGADPN